MELGIEAAQWMVGKALGPVSSGVLEAWAASGELGPNIKALRMELLYAEGMLNNARIHGRSGPGTNNNPALSELLQELRDLAYRADDVLDEVDYFRIQDELDGTYHAAEEHDRGCLRNHALNARHTARAIAKMLGLDKCSACFASRNGEPVENTRTRLSCGGHWPCCGIKTRHDDEEDEDATREVLCGAVWPCGRASSTLPANHGDGPAVGNGCMGRITSAARDTVHSVGKHFPCCSVSTIQNVAANDSSIASSGRRFFCCARPNKAPQSQHIVQTPKLKFYRAEMSQKMKDIVHELKPLCAKVSTILNLELLAAKLNNNGQYMANKSRPITTSDSMGDEFCGREDVTSQLIQDIKEGKYRHVDLTVLPIVGPGGIGKTTFTQHIYKKLQDHFEIKIWVCVSVNFNVSRLTQEIADKIKKEEKDSPESRIEEGLKSKRFLLVLDDIWSCSNEDEWNRFLVPFKKGQTKGSVILVTTRFPALAQIMVKTTDHFIDLKGMDEKAFKELFNTYVFGNKEPPKGHSELLGIGEEIIKKLKGSPLAAKTVGRLLRNHLDLVHWSRVLESREWESQSGEHDIMPALKLSFDYLPFHLQQCFAYCSLFPEDYKFSGEEIIHFWIGLNVLHSRGESKKIEDIGQSYLVELINHGFFKKEEDDSGQTYYVIHDLMHELGLNVSAHECLSIYSSNVRSIQIHPSIRHLSINIDDSSFKDRKAFDIGKEDFSVLGERLRVENLHSLMLFGKHQGSFAKTFHGLFSRAKSLRAILVSGDFYSMEDLLHNFSELIHLRYLRVHNNTLYGDRNKLPASNSISRFYHMRVLDLQGCKDCHDLPRHMSSLVKLRHFLVDKFGTEHSRISEVGKLKSLQELKEFEVGKEGKGFEMSQIGHLVELCGSLRIHNLENVDGREGADEAKLIHKKNLEELLLCWSRDRSNKDATREEQVLECLMPHNNLQKLSIRGSGGRTCPSWLGMNLSVQNLESLCLDDVDWETFPPIGELQLVNKGAKELMSNSPSQHFKNLKSITLFNLKRLERWVIGSSVGQLLSHLEVLIIRHCPELVELQFSYCNDTQSQQDLKTWPPNLRRLVIEDCPKLLSFPPVPWTCSPCSIQMSRVGLCFEGLAYVKDYDSTSALRITGKSTQDSASFWKRLDFGNLTEVRKLDMTACPPIALDDLRKLPSLSQLSIYDCNNAFGPVEDERYAGYQFAVESMEIIRVGAINGKELTQVLSYMPKLSKLGIDGCGKITGLGGVQQKQDEAAACYSASSSRGKEEIEGAEEEGLLLLPPHLHNLSIRFSPELSLRPDRGGLQTLCSLRSLTIIDCPKFLSCYSSSSSSFPFPSSLQSLLLHRVETLAPLSNLTSLATLKIVDCGGDARGAGLGRLLAHGCLQELTVVQTTTNFFSIGSDEQGLSIPSSSIQLSSLVTDDVAGALAAPICRLLSSSLTKLILCETKEMERFTPEQDEALQLLTSLQHLEFSICEKLQSLPAGLHRLTSLKTLGIWYCPSIGLLPKDGLPNSLQNLTINGCSAIHSLPKGSLPNSLQNLTIYGCSALRSLPKDGLPNSLQELHIRYCPSIRALPKGSLPTSLKLLVVSDGNSEELKRQCRNLIGTIPIVKLD